LAYFAVAAPAPKAECPPFWCDGRIRGGGEVRGKGGVWLFLELFWGWGSH